MSETVVLLLVVAMGFIAVALIALDKHDRHQ